MKKMTFDEMQMRKNYYRDRYRSLVKWNLLSVLAILIQCTLVAFLYFIKSDSTYYATNDQSVISPLRAYAKPNYTNQALLAPDLPEETGVGVISID